MVWQHFSTTVAYYLAAMTLEWSVSDVFDVKYCEIISFHEHSILWIGNNKHVRERLEFMDFKLYTILLKWISICWHLKFVDCPTNEIHEIKSFKMPSK